MGQIWLHIGSPKTGTTSLQGFLNANQEMLRAECGVNFMTSGRSHIAHNQLATSARMGQTGPLFDKIAAEADAMPDHTHIISSELLFNPFTTRRLTRAVPDMMKGRTKVICYLRRQDHYVEALYKQFLKNGRIPPDREAFLKDCLRIVRYLDGLNAYARAFGAENVCVRPFSTSRLTGGDVVMDFAKVVGLKMQPGMIMNKEFSNRTFSAEMSEALALMGSHTDFNVREVIRELTSLNLPNTIKSRDVFTKAQRRSLMEQMVDENRKIVRRYLPKDATFFDFDDLASDEEQDQLALKDRLRDREAATKALLVAMGNLQRRRQQEAELASEAEAASASRNDLEDRDEPPSWFREIYPAGARDGWYRKFGDHSCSFVDRGRAQLVVSFDNLSQAGNEAYSREPWAQKFCEDRGFSHLGVYAQTPNWFRSKALIDALETMRDDGFFKQFDEVAFVGTSMGGFAALTFSALSPGARVVAFSPQTTLDKALVPWEERFANGRAADWSLAFSDAAKETRRAKQVFVIYDPFHASDKAHIDRLKGKNIIRLKGFGLGHKSALALNRMEALKAVMEGGIAGNLEPSSFYKMLRARKDIYLYRHTMEGYLAAKGEDARRNRFAAAFKQRRRELLASQAS